MWASRFWSWLRRHAVATDDLDLAPSDAADLRRAAARVAGEYALTAPEVIVATAGRLLRRQVPVSAVRGSAVAPGVGELQFADGTVMIVRGEHQGDLSRVSVRLLTARVKLGGFAIEPSGVNLDVFVSGHRSRLHALGVRQPR